MTGEELRTLINNVVHVHAELQGVELKAAKNGCPKRLYDTLSSFSNQDDGGVILFGIDEKNGFERCGVYDAQDLQQRITEQCNEMYPVVRPLISHLEEDGKHYVTAEIPAIDVSERPCHYSGKGRQKGSYVRVGVFDEPMTEYEIYSYEAYRKKYQDDIRTVSRVTDKSMDQAAISDYLQRRIADKPNLTRLDENQIKELMGITRNGEYTLTAALLFNLYPQAYFPQLSIIATALASTEVGQPGPDGERFLDNRRIEGTVKEMLTESIAFVRKNTRIKTVIDPHSAQRADIAEYPVTAVREVILNALVHRDYSVHTEGMPIQLQIFSDRIEVTNPGGLYGRLRIDQLGKTQPDTRNPVLATALETLKITENRYSGIPTIRNEMAKLGHPMPQFEVIRGTFKVTLFKDRKSVSKKQFDDSQILSFCSVPRTRKELAVFLGVNSVSYAITNYINPLVEIGKIRLSNPGHPKSPSQTYTAI